MTAPLPPTPLAVPLPRRVPSTRRRSLIAGLWGVALVIGLWEAMADQQLASLILNPLGLVGAIGGMIHTIVSALVGS
jgi:hypothetical protein